MYIDRCILKLICPTLNHSACNLFAFHGIANILLELDRNLMLDPYNKLLLYEVNRDHFLSLKSQLKPQATEHISSLL